MSSELKVDTISEKTSTNGVVVDGVTIKDGAIASSFISGLSSGLSQADEWLLTASHTGDGAITNTYARRANDGFGYIGSGMSVSSGVFTFPATGYYLVVFNGQFYTSSNGENRSIEAQLSYTTNNSSYGETSTGRTNTSNTGASTYAGAYTEFVFDITDVSNQKVRTRVYGNQAFRVIGATSDRVYTSIRFMKLANT